MTERQARLIRKGLQAAHYLTSEARANPTHRLNMPAPGGLAGHAFRTTMDKQRRHLQPLGLSVLMSPDNRIVTVTPW